LEVDFKPRRTSWQRTETGMKKTAGGGITSAPDRTATGRNYEEFRPAYQYGFESGQHNMGRGWNEVESDLRSGWEKFEGRKGAGGTWDSVKHAVKDAWDRITGHHEVDTDKMADFEEDRVTRGGRL
jgi:hypothetical protein